MIICCQTCNKEFSISPSRLGIRKSCSVACSQSRFTTGIKPWNKGLTVTDPRVAQYGSKGSETRTGRKIGWKTGFYKGFSPWNKGGSWNESQREKLTGPRPAQRGAANPNFNPNRDRDAQQFRHTVAYKEWRKTILAKFNYTCQLCAKRGCKLIVDHFPYPFAKYPEHRIDPSNGRPLCKDCNYQVTFVERVWSHA